MNEKKRRHDLPPEHSVTVMKPREMLEKFRELFCEGQKSAAVLMEELAESLAKRRHVEPMLLRQIHCEAPGLSEKVIVGIMVATLNGGAATIRTKSAEFAASDNPYDQEEGPHGPDCECEPAAQGSDAN